MPKELKIILFAGFGTSFTLVFIIKLIEGVGVVQAVIQVVYAAGLMVAVILLGLFFFWLGLKLFGDK